MLFFKNKIKDLLKQRINLWLNKRIPFSSSHTLTSRNIFILPTRFGFCYLCFVILLFLLGTNYQNNIIILFSYLLASFFITVMLHSFFNLSQLTLNVSSHQQHQTGYVEQTINFPLNITANKSHYDINLMLKELPSELTFKEKNVQVAHCEKGNNSTKLVVLCNKRGQYALGRVTVYSEYSFGLFRAWSQLAFNQQIIVYPKPERLINRESQLLSDRSEQGENIYRNQNQRGTDDFSEFKNFVKGESKSRTAWKQLAKGQGHFTKHYQENQGGTQWLKLSNMPSVNIEKQLSYLTYLVNELTRNKQPFGLELRKGDIEIPPNSGSTHRNLCLQALARY
jgi:uncharacterized protein (DUF58 family)